jgi:hypothetical protein
MSGGMTPKIMRPQIDTRQLARLFYHHASSIVCNWENPLFNFNTLVLNVFSKSVCNFLGNVHDFGFPATFRIWQCDFAVLDIHRSDFERIFFSKANTKVVSPLSALGY